MIAGLWVAPAVLAGMVAVLWATTWLERLVAPPATGPDLDTSRAFTGIITVTIVASERDGVARRAAGGLGAHPSRTQSS